MSSVVDIVNDMTNDQILESKLLDLTIDHYEYLTGEELQTETDETLFLFLLLASRRVDMAIEEDDKIDILMKVIDKRLEQIIDILGVDENQVLNSLNHVNDIVLQSLIIFFYSLDDKTVFYKMLEYIMDMEEDNKNLSTCIEVIDSLMKDVIGYDNEIMVRTIINHENWNQLKVILDDIFIENPIFLDIIKEEFSDSIISEYY